MEEERGGEERRGEEGRRGEHGLEVAGAARSERGEGAAAHIRGAAWCHQQWLVCM